MDEQTTSSQLDTIPARLFFSALPNGALEFSCFVRLLGQNTSLVACGEITWSIADTNLLTASPLPIALTVVGRTYAPQAGEIIEGYT